MAIRDLDIEVDVEVDGSELERVNRQADELIETLEKLDKTYHIDIDLDTVPALAQLERLEQKLREIDNHINIDIDVDSMGALAELGALESLLEQIEHDKIRIDFDISTMGALSELSAFESLLETLEQNDFEIHVDANISDALSELATLETAIQELDNSTINIDIDIGAAMTQLAALQAQIAALHVGNDIDVNLDTATLQAQILALQAQLDALGSNPPEIDVHTQAANAVVELERIQNIVDDLDAEDIFLNVDVDNLSADIIALRARIRAIEASGIDVHMDTAAAHAQLAALQAHLNALQMQANGVQVAGGLAGMLANVNPIGLAVAGATFLVVLTAILAILPPLAVAINVAIGAVGVLAVALGTLGGAALALGSALAIGGVGLIGFGMLASSSIMALYEEKAKLTAAQKELKVQTDKVADSWNNLKTTLQPTVLTATTSAVKAINTLLDAGEPILKKVGTATAGLMDNLNKSLKGNEMQAFFSMVKKDIGPITTNLGNGFGNALRGVANTMTALRPLTSWVSQGFENMMGRFSNWASGLIGSNKIQSFIEYIKVNAPKIGSALGNATQGIAKLGASFSGIGADGFTWFQSKMEQFNNWASNLGNNQGFQNFLNSIRENAPAVGQIITELGNSLRTFWTVMTDDSSGGASRLESFANGLKSLSNVLKDENLQDVISGAFNFDMSKIVSGLTGGIGNGGFGVEGGIKKSVSASIEKGLLEGITNGSTNLTFAGAAGNIVDGLMNKFLGGGSSKIEVPVEANTEKLQSSITSMPKTNIPLEADMGGALSESLAKVPKTKVPIGADVSPAKTEMKNLEAQKIKADVDANTANAHSKIVALEATPIRIKTDTSSIASTITNMAATIKLSADTSTIKNSISNMPDAKVKVTADTASLKNSIGNMPDAKITLRADTIKVTNNITPVDVPVNPIMRATKLFESNSATVDIKPRIVEQPKFDPVTIKAKLQVDQSSLSGLGAIGGGIKVNFGPMPKFSWPPIPKFTWPPLPKFSWPPLPKWTWPPMPKFTWPAYPRFSWPPFPKFSWPPMPTVKVSVSGAANGSHANGMGRIPFDGYNSILHKDETVLQAHNADLLRGMGILKGDGENPSLDMSAIANYQPAASSNNPKARVSSVNKSASDNSKKEYNITVNVDGSKNPEETAASITDHLQNWLASLEDANPQVYEY